MKKAFSLIELLTTVAALVLLAALAAPALLQALERSRVGRVVADLQTVEVALESYRTDHGRYPPVTLSCMAADAEQELQLPQELADGGYLPRNPRPATSTLLEDPFRPGHTYKYAAPENYYLNGEMQPGRFATWVPDDFPSCQAAGGKADRSANSPLAWAAWSRGPRPDSAKARDAKAPLAAATWYQRAGDEGVIARYKARDGATWSTLRR